MITFKLDKRAIKAGGERLYKEFKKNTRTGLHAGGIKTVDNIKKLFSGSAPSSPGRAPAVITGTYASSIVYVIEETDDAIRMITGSDPKALPSERIGKSKNLAHWLEFGTGSEGESNPKYNYSPSKKDITPKKEGGWLVFQTADEQWHKVKSVKGIAPRPHIIPGAMMSRKDVAKMIRAAFP